MKITIYELLGMVKDELPKRIKIENDIFIYDNKENDYIYEDGNVSLFTDYIPDIYHLEDLKEALNQQVEILEEEKKIPEKIKSNGKEFYCDNIDSWIDKEETSAYCEYLMNKYNDLIDYLKSKGE
jgi:uncharacterized protein (DUF1697 family)